MAPFWRQSHESIRLILDHPWGTVQGARGTLKTTMALAIYTTLAYLGSRHILQGGGVGRFPATKDEVAFLLGISERTLPDYIGELEKLRLLRVTHSRGHHATQWELIDDFYPAVTSDEITEEPRRHGGWSIARRNKSKVHGKRKLLTDEQKTPDEPDDDAKPSEETTNASQEIEKVWNYWIERRVPSKSEMLPSQGRMIEKGLKEGFGVEELCLAIEGLLASRWHQDHDRLVLSAIFKTKPGGDSLADQVQRFIGDGKRAGGTATTSGGDERLVELRKRDVLTAHDYPNHSQAQELGRQAEEWLEEHGWSVVREPGKRPTFRRLSA